MCLRWNALRIGQSNVANTYRVVGALDGFGQEVQDWTHTYFPSMVSHKKIWDRHIGAERPCGHRRSRARSAGIGGKNAASMACLLKGEYRRERCLCG